MSPVLTLFIHCAQTEIDQRVVELGGVHKYDLTPDVTHLIVGDYDTPKYRHVARERPDIKPMDAGWIQAVLEKWKNADEMDFANLEAEYRLKPLEKCGAEPALPGQQPERDSLLICLTGFGEQRQQIADLIVENGARYTGDLTRKCSHLIVSAPEGKKFTAAKSWGVNTVTLAWLYQSVERRMILEESKFDPLLPPEEQGKGAWVKKDPRRASLGKRSRSSGSTAPEDGVRKLRKTASMKLSSQHSHLWGDILGRSASREYSFAKDEASDETPPQQAKEASPAVPELTGTFAHCIFFLHGFKTAQTDILEQTISSLDGTIAPTLKAAAISPPTSDPYHRFLVVPQTSPPETHPQSQYDNLYIVTEFYIERCLHNKQFYHPDTQVLGRPFPAFPVRGFADLTICSAAFTGLELSQLARSVRQLGAKFDEEFRRTTNVLLCRELSSMRKDKLKYALEWGVPVVSADWLWECISTGFKVPITDYIYPELRSRYSVKAESESSAARMPKMPKESQPLGKQKKSATTRPPPGAKVDISAFDDASPEKANTKKSTNTNLHDERATPADFANTGNKNQQDSDTPLSEKSSASINKSPSPAKSTSKPLRNKSESTTDTENSDASKLQQPSLPDDNKARRDETTVQNADSEARQAAKASERQRLTSRITSLLDSAKPTPPMEFDAAVGSAPAQPRPRKRQILGRAISNASNASSGGSGQVPESMRSASALGGLDDDEHDNEDHEPPSTQLEYRDPQAQERKAMLISRMMSGEDAANGAVSTTASGEDTIVGGRTLRKRT